MRSKIVLLVASVFMMLSVFVVPSVALALTVDKSLAKPVLQRYDLNGKSVQPPYTAEVALVKGDKLYLTGSSFPGGKVTVIAGTKSYIADGVSNGTWGVTIKTEDLPSGVDSITAQGILGERSTEIIPVLKINVAGAVTENKGDTNFLSNKYVLAGFGIFVLALLVFLGKKYRVFSKLTKKKSKKK
jgi:hypothetical protein